MAHLVERFHRSHVAAVEIYIIESLSLHYCCKPVHIHVSAAVIAQPLRPDIGISRSIRHLPAKCVAPEHKAEGIGGRYLLEILYNRGQPHRVGGESRNIISANGFDPFGCHLFQRGRRGIAVVVVDYQSVALEGAFGCSGRHVAEIPIVITAEIVVSEHIHKDCPADLDGRWRRRWHRCRFIVARATRGSECSRDQSGDQRQQNAWEFASHNSITQTGMQYCLCCASCISVRRAWDWRGNPYMPYADHPRVRWCRSIREHGFSIHRAACGVCRWVSMCPREYALHTLRL